MRIALINENSQAAKNSIIEDSLRKIADAKGYEVVNYGMYGAEDAAQLTYVQNGILAAVLLNSGAADFVVTGCGTGEGAMLALNSFPGVICGHVATTLDAYTFAQINDGNACPQHCVLQVIAYAKFIDCMTTLVDYRIHGSDQIMVSVIGCDTYVSIVKIQSERMLNLSNRTVRAVKSLYLHQIVGKLLLFRYRIVHVYKTVIDLWLLSDGMYKWYQTISHLCKEMIQILLCHSAFVAVQQHIVRRLTVIVILSKSLCIVNDFFKNRLEKCIVICHLCLMPDVRRLIDESCIFHILLCGNAGNIIILTPELLNLTAVYQIQVL